MQTHLRRSFSQKLISFEIQSILSKKLREMIMIKRTIVMSLFLLSCSTTSTKNPETGVRKKAAFDFQCGQSSIEVKKEDQVYLARGCGKTATYTVRCTLGPCMATKIK